MSTQKLSSPLLLHVYILALPPYFDHHTIFKCMYVFYARAKKFFCVRSEHASLALYLGPWHSLCNELAIKFPTVKCSLNNT